MASMHSISQLTRIYLDDGTTLMVKASGVELATAINRAYLNGEVAVNLTARNGDDVGVMLSRVVKWN